MSLIDQVFNFSSLVLWSQALSRNIRLSKCFNGLCWLLIKLEEQKLKVNAVLECTNQIETLRVVHVLQDLIELNAVTFWLEVGA